MNRFRYLAIVTMLAAALTAPAQQTVTGSGGIDKDKHGQRTAPGSVPIVEQQLKVLTDRLHLTGDQPARMKPILQELHDFTEKLVQDKSLSREERLAKARPQFYQADKQMREILNEDQKKKLDQYEQEPHPEMHGNLNEEPPPSQPSQNPNS